MKSVLAAGVIGLAASAASAAIVVTGTETGLYGGFSEITFKITSIGAGEIAVNSIQGTFTGIGTAPLISLPGTTLTLWRNNALNTTADPGNAYTPPHSGFNFDSQTGTWSRTPNAAEVTSFSGTAFTSDNTAFLKPGPDDDAGTGGDNSINEEVVAIIFVKGGPGQFGVSFSGSYNSQTVQDAPVTFQALIPEPATAGLMSLGALGLLARRRRA
jgi:hypothetical protein